MTKDFEGPEKRKNGMYDDEFKTLLALVKQRVEFIELNVTEISSDIKEIRSKFDENNILRKEDLDEHAHQDRWMFGVLLTMLVGIFIKLFLK